MMEICITVVLAFIGFVTTETPEKVGDQWFSIAGWFGLIGGLILVGIYWLALKIVGDRNN